MVAFTLLLTCKPALHGQHSKRNDFDSTMNVIKMSIARQEWKLAESAIQNLERASLPKSKAPEILFIRGYLYQREASVETDSVKEQELMARALSTYLRASDLAPRNGSLHQNIAILYAQQNKTTDAIARMQLAYRQEKLPAYSSFLGDLYMQAGQYDSARRFYEQTIKDDPFNEPVYDRLQYVYRRVNVSPDDVLTLCNEMCKTGHTRVAATMMADLVRRNYKDEAQQKQVERAFVWWVNLLGRRQAANKHFTKVFDIPWDHPAYQELLEVWRNPERYPRMDWWLRDVPLKLSNDLTVIPIEVFVGALQELGGQLIEKDSIAVGVDVYLRAFEIIAGRNEDAVSTNRESPDIFFEAANNLGVAYARYPSIDPGGIRFNSLANRLLFGKGEAYRSNNRKAIAKFHTTLGVIYATKKEWDQPNPANGIFQLERAIACAPETQNTASLKVLLAGGYLKKQNFDAARNMLLLAAGDFLNDDNLSTASHALARYDSIQGDKHAAGFRDLSKIIAFRNQIPRLTSASFQDVDKLNDAIDSLTQGSALPANFYKIQRFKILSDCGTRAIKVDDSDAATVLHIKALKQASEVDNMGNLNDFNRLNQQQKTIKESIPFEGRSRPETIKRSQSSLQGVKTWQAPAPGNDRGEQLQMKTDVLVAAQVADVINEQAATSPEQKPQVVINQTENTVEIRHNATPGKTLKRELEKPVKKTGMDIQYKRTPH